MPSSHHLKPTSNLGMVVAISKPNANFMALVLHDAIYMPTLGQPYGPGFASCNPYANLNRQKVDAPPLGMVVAWVDTWHTSCNTLI